MATSSKRTSASERVARLSDEIARIENKIDRLQFWVSLQTLLLTAISVSYLFELTRYLVFALLIMLPIVYIFRNQLPGWFQRVGRVLAFLRRRRERT